MPTAPACTAPTPPSREELLGRIDADPLLAALLGEVRSRTSGDGAHDLGHLLRVAGWTLALAEESVSPTEAIVAALLHDLVNVPKSSAQRSEASAQSAAEARRLLADRDVDPEAVERIAQAIIDHSFSRGAVPRSDLGRALQDADRLEALGAIGVFRCAATGAAMGTDFFDGDDPWAVHRELDDRHHSVDHFFVKLLRLPATMTTGAGRREAHRRARFMARFLRQLGEEIGSPPPVTRLAED
ncbi:MAG: HD domain-containing protein [Deltaproteobacteria bacterium]|nr:HD domain-containing protein [Deltaproteobacteria bacterium]